MLQNKPELSALAPEVSPAALQVEEHCSQEGTLQPGGGHCSQHRADPSSPLPQALSVQMIVVLWHRAVSLSDLESQLQHKGNTRGPFREGEIWDQGWKRAWPSPQGCRKLHILWGEATDCVWPHWVWRTFYWHVLETALTETCVFSLLSAHLWEESGCVFSLAPHSPFCERQNCLPWNNTFIIQKLFAFYRWWVKSLIKEILDRLQQLCGTMIHTPPPDSINRFPRARQNWSKDIRNWLLELEITRPHS